MAGPRGFDAVYGIVHDQDPVDPRAALGFRNICLRVRSALWPVRGHGYRRQSKSSWSSPPEPGVGTKDPLRVLFNVSSAALSIWIASKVFYYAAGIPPLASHEAPLHTLILPLALLSSTYFLLNSGTVAIAMAIQKRDSAIALWRTNFLGLAVNYFGGASLAALFVSYTRTIDLVALGVIVPLLIISYLTFKTSLGRVEDATRHVEEVKRLYLSTIETLATAIDAKDQVTHGHIRRVQQFALGLARELGVRDQSQLQALEAAALAA